ncbi:fumarylacetoacetate hydrolase family protein [Pedobacter alluvionis]|uniref:2-dehydro-3-deoxy-D-arabinonate dehydratase n=1 Tax=Pedobacter alluvionis TaxID=475253 RepID=A0A497XT31_9SPHI|nr:fumarylacetoacetate hydrolase family protein [Pedobacter alluvionis]RLJ72491.1 2-dehydro-3-deoxy-D-arabinonate dehydratase [Pedobacter alluvionis]TFB28185.1 2-hydroxyhepta-2,4-diene-1,7-dioate isomerase [Pedobacter alluvionis]
MRIYNTSSGIIINHNNQYFLTEEKSWDKFVNRSNLFKVVSSELQQLQPNEDLQALTNSAVLTPIGNQEVWASGVTYFRSREARIEESKEAKGGDFYARVYDADRPELFFKSPPYRTVGPGGNIRIRADSKWNVPEPELTLFICSAGTIEGYTIGNDVSSRDIEGENPLYLPQAKSYNGATALGPCLLVTDGPIDPDTDISIEIFRDSEVLFKEKISINQMKRKHKDLVSYLFRELDFPHGTYLMTGTGIIPTDDFTLKSGDLVKITISEIGSLINIVA